MTLISIIAINTLLCHNYYKIHGPRGYEELLPVICEPRREIEIIGAAGLVAVNDEYFTC